MKIIVIGGTGLIGSKTVAILRQGGHEVVAASPKSGVNTVTGEGVKEAVVGVQVVIDLANSRATKRHRRDRRPGTGAVQRNRRPLSEGGRRPA
jgi:nucleoside-diphosphate-sugar epimerase